MSRVLKFRAWDEKKNIMHENFQFLQSGDEGNDWVCFTSDKQKNIHDAVKNPHFSQQLKKMQFTGSKDKNGKDIYDGDIVKVTNKAYMNGNYVVVFDPVQLCFCLVLVSLYSPDWNSSGPGRYLRATNSVGCEIIGNIYETPELLNSELKDIKKYKK